MRVLQKAKNHVQQHRVSILSKKLVSDIIEELNPKEQADRTIVLFLQDGLTAPKSSAFIRLILPLTAVGIKVIIADETNAKIPKDIFAVIVQRTALNTLEIAIDIVARCKERNIPLVVDTDDAFNLIDTTHPEYEQQRKKIEALDYVIAHANLVTFSTSNLSDYYKKTAKNRLVIPNTLDTRLWIKSDSRDSAKNKLSILYMGTATHDADFKMIFPALDAAYNSNPGSFSLTVIGISKEIPQRQWIHRLVQEKNGAIYPNFVKWFIRQGPFDIGIAPLVDSPFNQAKSDIKCLDYLGAGIVPVVSNIDAYNTPGLTPAIFRVDNTLDDWAHIITKLSNDIKKSRAKLNEKLKIGSAYISHDRNSAKAGETLIDAISLLLK